METVPLSLLYTYIERESESWSGNGLSSRGNERCCWRLLCPKGISSAGKIGGNIFSGRANLRKESRTRFPPLNFPMFTSKLDILNLK